MSADIDDGTKCLEAQIEEIEVLRSIYADEWKTESEADRSYSIEIKHDNICATLYVTLPESYPFESPPSYTLLAPDLRRNQKDHLASLLDDVYLKNLGQTVIFQWIDKIKEYLSSLEINSENCSEDFSENDPESSVTNFEPKTEFSEIVHGEQIIDRKSIFQGHAAIVFSAEEVRCTLEELKKNKKIAKATHNMYAYRIIKNNNTCIQDCNDDGESNAGGRLLHLLQILDVSNVVVVVSRWYGGIHLGPVRFKHINNAARQVLEQAGLLSNSKSKT